MKRLLFLAIALCSLSVTGNAQYKTFGNATDTAVNAETNYLTTSAQGYASVTTIQLNVTKVSGTVAGTAIVQGSIDGTNYVTIIPADTFTLANVASQTYIWKLGTSNYSHYRIAYTTSGTQRSIPMAAILLRKP